MTDKTKALTKVDILKNPNLNTSIDLRVSFKDILDMVVSEQESELEKVLDDLAAQRKTLEKKQKKVVEDVQEELKTEGRRHYRSQLKSLEKLFGSPSQIDKYGRDRFVYRGRLENFYDVPDKVRPDCVSVCTQIEFIFGKPNDGENYCRLQYSPKVFESPSLKTVTKLSSELVKLEEKTEEVEQEMSKLRTRAKALKAGAVRKILEQSPEGKQVLSVVGSKEQIKLLLAEPSVVVS